MLSARVTSKVPVAHSSTQLPKYCSNATFELCDFGTVVVAVKLDGPPSVFSLSQVNFDEVKLRMTSLRR